MELDRIAGRIEHEGLGITGDEERISNLEPLGAELVDESCQIEDLERHVLADIRRKRSFEEMDLARTKVDPRPVDPEVRPVRSQRAAKARGVEGHRGWDIVDVERDMVDAKRLHGGSLACLGP